MTLEQDLRRYVDEAADPVTIEEILASLPLDPQPTLTTIRRKSHRVLVAFVLVTLAAAGIALTALGGRSTTTTAFGGDDSALVGEWAEIQAAAGQLEPGIPTATLNISEISRLSRGFFALGTEADARTTKGALWWSPEGSDWQRISDDAFELEIGPDRDYVPSGIRFDTIIESTMESSGRLVLVGEQTGTSISPVFFYSDDGRSWRHAPIELELDDDTPITLGGAVATNNGFLVMSLVNSDLYTGQGNTIIAWRSDDGMAWQQFIPLGFETGAYVSAVTAIEDRLLAVGSVGGSNGQAAAWVSDNSGITWTRATVEAADSSLPVSEMFRLAVGPGRLLALGYRSTGPVSTGRRDDEPLVIDGSRDPSVWYSIDDGLTWTEVPFSPSPNSLEIEGTLTSGPGGFLVTTTSISGSGTETLAWTTIDGILLTPLAVPAAVVRVVAATAHDDKYLVATDGRDLVSIDHGPFGPTGPIRLWHIK